MCTTPHAHATCLCKLCLYHADADQMAVMLRYRLIWEVSCPNDQALGRVTRTPLRPAACVRSVQCVRLTIRVKRFCQVAKAAQGIMYLRGTKASKLHVCTHYSHCRVCLMTYQEDIVDVWIVVPGIRPFPQRRVYQDVYNCMASVFPWGPHQSTLVTLHGCKSNLI